MRAGAVLDKITRRMSAPAGRGSVRMESGKKRGNEMDLSPDIREVVRYLGYHGVAPDPEVMREISEALR